LRKYSLVLYQFEGGAKPPLSGMRGGFSPLAPPLSAAPDPRYNLKMLKHYRILQN